MKKFLKIFSAYLLSILVAYGVSFGLVNFQNFVSGDSGNIEISDFEVSEQKTADSDGNEITKTILSFDNAGRYMNKLQFDYDADSNFTWEIEYDETDNTDRAKIIDGENSKAIHIFSERINARVGAVKITTSCNDGEVAIKNLRVNNEIQYFGRTYIITIALFVTIATLIIFRKRLAGKPEWIFLVLYLPASIALISAQGVWTGHAPDDQIHFSMVQDVVNDNYATSETPYADVDYGLWNTEEENSEHADSINSEWSYLDDTARPNFTFQSLGYVGLVIGQWIGVAFNANFTAVATISVIFEALVFAIVVFFAIRKAPYGKYIILVIALFPRVMFTGVSYSYDSTVLAFALLGASYYLYEFVNIQKKLEPKNIAIILLSFVIICAAKPPYIILAMPLLFLPRTKFLSARNAKIFKIATFAVMALLGSVFILNSAMLGKEITDVRGGDVGIGRQIKYAIKHPANTINIVSTTATVTPHRMFSVDAFDSYVYLGDPSNRNSYYIILFLLALSVVAGVQSGKVIEKKYKWVILITCILLISAIWGSMWLAYNPVGASTLGGVQSRYFWPLLFPLLGLLCTPKIKTTLGDKWLLYVFSILELVAIYNSMFSVLT